VSFTWPAALLLALVVPGSLAIYLWAVRRRRRQAVTYSSLALLRLAMPRRSTWRRHVPVALLLAGLAVLAVAAGRPQLTSYVAVDKTTIILALDQSGSMCLSDMLPDRLTVAQDAAREFVDAQPKGTQMGLVLFAGYAELAVPPTADRSTLDEALDNLSTSPGTAIGAAILKSLDAISEVDPQVQPVGNAVSNAALAPSGNPTGSSGTPSPGPAPTPPKGGYSPDIIVLLTDGANNRGITPLQAVPYAVARRVRVYTIGIGTTHMAAFRCTPQQQGGLDPNGGYGPTGSYGGGGYGGGPYGGGPFGGGFGPGSSRLVADLPPLEEVSRLTGGLSFSAKDAPELDKVFAELPKHVALQKERHEVTATFAVAGALLALAAIGAALRWAPYP
jgi:Ca-activated chloride channel homolog